jgi:hypothetical protein
MARAVRLDQLRTDARLYADQRHGGATPFVSDTELDRLINLKLAELYDRIVAAGGHEYYANEHPLSVNSGQARYTLPSLFYRMLSVTLEWADRDHEVVRDLAHLQLASDYRNWSTWCSWSPKAYRLRGGNLEFFPTPTSAVTARLQYVPVFSDLEEDSDTFDGVNGWEKLVAVGVAIEMRIIEQNDYADLQALYAEQLERIEAMAADRDNHPKQVIDAYPEAEGSRIWWPRGTVA